MLVLSEAIKRHRPALVFMATVSLAVKLSLSMRETMQQMMCLETRITATQQRMRTEISVTG